MKRTQEAAILKHLERGWTLTPLQALHQYGCFRLAARIADLRRKGCRIETKILASKGKNFASYRLIASGRKQ